MSANVEQEEADAIRAAFAPEPGAGTLPPAGAARFVSAFDGVQRAIVASLTRVEEALESVLGRHYDVELEELAEVRVDGLFDDAEEHQAALRFELAGERGWLVWDIVSAIRTVERSMGGGDGAAVEARAVSSLEGALLDGILRGFVDAPAAALGLDVGRPVLVRTPTELGSWRDGGRGASPDRTVIRMRFHGPGAPSTLSLYLPLRLTATPEAKRAKALALPAHLSEVELDVRVRFGACHVRLDQLLSLESGDVIPLDTARDDPAELVVDGVPFARGTVGSHRGQFAVRLEEFVHPPLEEPV